MKGCDTNRKLTPQLIACLKKQRMTFICRYLRNLLPKEVRAISDAGLQIVSIFEMGKPTTAAYFSRAKGLKDGRIAVQSALKLKQPEGTVIYAAVDFDVLKSELSRIEAYFQGFRDAGAELNSSYFVGGYGSGLVLAHLQAKNLISAAWLSGSTGWQGSRAFKAWQIKQGKQAPVCGVEIDRDEAQGGFGSWTLAQPTPQAENA